MVNCIVIDDDQNIVELFCELLKTINVDVLAIGKDGNDAVKLYETHMPDIVFTDFLMPNYDGEYAIENIKDRNPNAKIILITGEPNAISPYLLDSLNVFVIQKPFEIQTIKESISKILSNKDEKLKPLKIKYKFKTDENSYICSVTYQQYRNLKQLPLIQNCEIINTSENASEQQMEKALRSAINDMTEDIHRLSEVVPEN